MRSHGIGTGAGPETMKAIVRRLEHLERHRALVTVDYDAGAVLLQRINAIAERMRAGGNWPPEPRPTVEQVQERLNAIVAA